MPATACPVRVSPSEWPERIPAEEWAIYRAVLEKTRARGILHAVGGGLTFSAYAGRWRHTKDLDIYVREGDRSAMIEILTEAGLQDYHPQRAYDRRWIYRGYRGGVIVDVMWQMANYRAKVDDSWLTRGPQFEVDGLTVRLLAPEELVWSKLYVMQRERCDWPDLFNVLHGVGPEMDWQHLLTRVDEDTRMLGGLLSVFAWLCPQRAYELPEWIWERVAVVRPEPGPVCQNGQGHVALLERGDWFGFTVGG